MKNSIVILLTIFLSNCAYHVPKHETILYSYSHKFNTCLKRDFVLSQDFVGQVGESIKVPLSECDNITGLKNVSDDGKDWPAFRAWLEEIFEGIEDNRKKLPFVDDSFTKDFQ